VLSPALVVGGVDLFAPKWKKRFPSRKKEEEKRKETTSMNRTGERTKEINPDLPTKKPDSLMFLIKSHDPTKNEKQNGVVPGDLPCARKKKSMTSQGQNCQGIRNEAIRNSHKKGGGNDYGGGGNGGKSS